MNDRLATPFAKLVTTVGNDVALTAVKVVGADGVANRHAAPVTAGIAARLAVAVNDTLLLCSTDTAAGGDDVTTGTSPLQSVPVDEMAAPTQLTRLAR